MIQHSNAWGYSAHGVSMMLGGSPSFYTHIEAEIDKASIW